MDTVYSVKESLVSLLHDVVKGLKCVISLQAEIPYVSSKMASSESAHKAELTVFFDSAVHMEASYQAILGPLK